MDSNAPQRGQSLCLGGGHLRFQGKVSLGCPWKLVYILLKGLITCLYRGYNPVTKYRQDIPLGITTVGGFSTTTVPGQGVFQKAQG